MTETIEYRTTDKTAWGDGPWLSEPDKRQWQDEATGLPCLIVRGPVGALCGYVGVPKEHPLHGVEYSAASPAVIPLSEYGSVTPESDFDVHGGLTYSRGCDHFGHPSEGVCHIPSAGEPDDVWWFGFDCSHYNDLAPRLATHQSPGSDLFHQRRYEIYRDLSYVTEEVTSLAAQLKAVGASS